MGGKRREADLIRAILTYLRTVPGVVAWRVNSGAVVGEYKGKRRFVRFNTMPGMSDILCILPPNGRLMAIEAKVESGRLRPDQQTFLAKINNAGGRGILASSVDDIRDALTS